VPKPPVVPIGASALGKGKTVLAAPPKVPATFEFEDAMKKVTAGLQSEAITKKYNAQALDKIRNLDLQTLHDSGINPSDLEKLSNSLARAGAKTQQFVNDFHDVPGFENVLLNWAKQSYWNTRLKTPAWTATKAFRTGTSYFMKFAVAKLDPKFVKFEFPVSITDTKWGEEVFARYVDVVVTGGTGVKPGQLIQIELKSWTSWVLQVKASGTTSTRGSVGYQLLRDTALFKPENIRWVFDGSKLQGKGKSFVIDEFLDIIANDDYLAQQWGGATADLNVIRGLLEKVIEIF
jgi:hypothetical protein